MKPAPESRFARRGSKPTPCIKTCIIGLLDRFYFNLYGASTPVVLVLPRADRQDSRYLAYDNSVCYSIQLFSLTNNYTPMYLMDYFISSSLQIEN